MAFTGVLLSTSALAASPSRSSLAIPRYRRRVNRSVIWERCFNGHPWTCFSRVRHPR
jgi:hypothetical protein